MYREQEVTLLELTCLLTSTVQTILPARLQFWYLRQQRLEKLKMSVFYMATVNLNAMTKEELAWWIKNLKIINVRAIIQSSSQILMQTNSSKKG